VQRSLLVILVALIVAVVGVGVIVWRADQQARDDAAETHCLERVQATAIVALLVPSAQVDAQGRLDAVERLGNEIEAC
jgi:hypothetical protein